LKLAKGYFGAKSKNFRIANQAVMKSLVYAYRTEEQEKEISESFGLQESMRLQE